MSTTDNTNRRKRPHDHGMPELVSILPRLNHSMMLIDRIIATLRECQRVSRVSNRHLRHDLDTTNPDQVRALSNERIQTFLLQALLAARSGLSREACSMSEMPDMLLPVLFIMRTIRAQLFDMVPECGRQISEASVYVGSIIIDTAMLAEARFGTAGSNSRALEMLDEIKMTTDSKLSKQYPNLIVSKLYSICY